MKKRKLTQKQMDEIDKRNAPPKDITDEQVAAWRKWKASRANGVGMFLCLGCRMPAQGFGHQRSCDSWSSDEDSKLWGWVLDMVKNDTIFPDGWGGE